MGAVAAVVEQPIDRPHVLVKDSFAALQALARAARGASCPKRG
jgi:UDP-N-acetylmuramoyl-tripeptide--D-alanyl-D-alanine ligase